MKYCTHCGKELLDEAVMCPACGNAVRKNREQDTRNAFYSEPIKPYDDAEEVKIEKRNKTLANYAAVLAFLRNIFIFAATLFVFCLYFFGAIIGSAVADGSGRLNIDFNNKKFFVVVFLAVCAVISFIVLLYKIHRKKKISVLFKIFVLIFCSVIAGVLLFCREEYIYE